MNKRKIIEIMNKHVGKQVMILKGDHANEKGKTIKAYYPLFKKEPAMRVKLDSGIEINVDDPTRLFFITQPIQVDRIKDN